MKKSQKILMLLSLLLIVLTACNNQKPQAGPKEATEEEESAVEETIEEAEEVETTEVTKTKSGLVTYNVDMTKYEAGEKVGLWLPLAYTKDYQEIVEVEFDANGGQGQITEDEIGNKMLYVEWPEDSAPQSRLVKASFHVSRQEVVSPELVEEGSMPEDLGEYLKATSTIPVDGNVKDLADQITNGQTTYLGKARAIYDWIVANMNRDESVIGCGLGDVETLLQSKLGKCTDINSVFVSLCRASGIPTREMFGIRINADDITKNQHCWTEFYLPGTGWVLADPADVLKAVLKNEWDKSSAEAKEIQEYYFGNAEAERIELTQGRDLVLSPAQEGQPLNNFGYPYAEVGDMIIDCYQPEDFAYTISFVEK